MTAAPPAAPEPEGAPRSAASNESGARAEGPPRGSIARAAIGVADALLGVALFAVLELYVVAIAARRELVGAYEAALARNLLLPIAFLTGAPLALAGFALVAVGRRAESKPARATLAAAALAAGSAIGWGVAGGRHFQGGLRAPFAIGLGAMGAVLAFALAPFLARALRRDRAFALGSAATVLALELANLTILPRLYPAFHLALAALATIAAAAGASVVAERARFGWARGALAALLVALGAVATVPAAKRLATLDNVRVIYVEHAPTLGRVVELAAAIAPPPPLDDEAAPIAEAKHGRAIDLGGRDLLLVTVDALRADHVGAYGYARPTTPRIDALAKDGVLFEAAYSPTPHTSYAVTSIMTGKYMRPLLLQGLGDDAETWASHLRRYGYRTAAFYPPAVFFIDGERFASVRDRYLDFEYRRVEFLAASGRVDQVKRYLARVAADKRVFLWVHLFEPHEPYEAHAEHAFGDRDVDRYDGEIAAADEAIGGIVDAVRAARPSTVVLVAADHGEEFGEHGGRYHGTTVYEEQVRVPLVVNAPGLLTPRRVAAPVQLVDLLPTVLAGLDIPRPARVRGNDLGPALVGAADASKDGFAFAETDQQTLLAKAPMRLVCERKIGACALYDVAKDPAERDDLANARAAEFQAMKAELRRVEASHGRYEVQGLRSEGKGWPEALRRGLAGDGDAATDVAALLDDADVVIRRKAAEVLFELKRAEVASALRLALVRDEDEGVKRFAALALTRLGEGAPKTRELLDDPDVAMRRLAALALAENGDDKGEETLVAWWREGFDPRQNKPIPFERARDVAAALGKLKARAAVGPLIASLGDLRLRPYVARALAAIGESSARPALAERFAEERYVPSRLALADALVALGAGPELRAPIVHFLGTPDPLPGGLGLAMKADLLELVGGPKKRDLDRVRKFATSGVAMGVVVPKGGNGAGVRAICRAKTLDGRPGELRIGVAAPGQGGRHDHDSLVPEKAPEVDRAREARMTIDSSEPVEVAATIPGPKIEAGSFADFVLYATQNVALDACAVVPLADEIPPPPPEPWKPPSDADQGEP